MKPPIGGDHKRLLFMDLVNYDDIWWYIDEKKKEINDEILGFDGILFVFCNKKKLYLIKILGSHQLVVIIKGYYLWIWLKY